MVYVEPYNIACIQTVMRLMKDEATKWEVIKENTNRICELIAGKGKYYSRPAKLVVLSEFCIQGSPAITWYDITSGMPRNKSKPRTYKMVAVEIPNEATDKIGETAVEQGCYVAVPFIEIVKDWPDWPFISSALISPKDGKVVMVYRKHCGPGMAYVPPAAIYSEYIKKYGEDSLFPVADTPIGKIGLFVCCDSFFPETIRCLVLHGAEVLCFGHGGGLPTNIDKTLAIVRVRAIENSAYVAMANMGGFKDGPRGSSGGGGYSCIVDYQGSVLARAETCGETSAVATVDINALRKARATGLALVSLPTKLYAKEYEKTEIFPLDALEGKPLDDMNQWNTIRNRILKNLYDKKILEKPE